jgi:ABC-type transport system substrate-binding protein
MSIYNHSNQLFDASLTFGQNLTCDGTSSTTCIPKVDALVKKASEISDQAQRQQLYDQAWTILQQQHAFVAIANVYHVSFLKKGLVWNPPADGFVRLQDISYSS